MFKRLNIQSKLLTGFIVVVLILLLLGIRQYVLLNSLRHGEVVAEQTHRVLEDLEKARLYLAKDELLVARLYMAESTAELDLLWEQRVQNSALLHTSLDQCEIDGQDPTWAEESPQLQRSLSELVGKLRSSHTNTLSDLSFRLSEDVRRALEGQSAPAPDAPEQQAADSLSAAPAATDSLTSDFFDLFDDPFFAPDPQAPPAEVPSGAVLPLLRQHGQEAAMLHDAIALVQAMLEAKAREASRGLALLSQGALLLTVVLVALGFFFSVFIAVVLAKSIVDPIKRVQLHMEELALGNLPEPLSYGSHDEISHIATLVNQLTEQLRKTRDFARDVGKGDFETTITAFDSQGALGKALDEMRDGLYQVAKEREQQQFEEDQRNWATRGLAMFAEILRKNDDDLVELSYVVVKNMVEYLGANQGGLFLINDNDPEDRHVELMASYAYGRRKASQKRIELDEGVVGRCIGESETIFMKELPEGYISITSGLGEAPPKFLLVVPLKINQDVFGVIELASFAEMLPFQIQFVEKVGESIASTLSAVKINKRTARLLSQAQDSAEEMAAQEEEMRQNLEMLQATQDEAARKEAEASSFVNSVNHTMIRADFDREGRLLYANSRFLEALGYTSREVEGQPIFMFIRDDDQLWFSQVWERLSNGGRHYEGEILCQGKSETSWLLSTFTVVRKPDGSASKILYLAFSVHKSKASTTLQIEQMRQSRQLYQDEVERMHLAWEQRVSHLEQAAEKARPALEVHLPPRPPVEREDTLGGMPNI